MVVAEALAGIALVKAAVNGIKSTIGTAKDIGEIASEIDALFTGEKQVQEARNKKAGGGIAAQFGVDTVAKEIIDAKLAAEKMQEVATMVDMRFGHGTWAGILAERQRRIQEAREAARERARAAAKRQAEIEEMLKVSGLVMGVVIAVIVAIIVAMQAAW